MTENLTYVTKARILHGSVAKMLTCELRDATIEFRDPDNIKTDILHDHIGRQDIAATSYTYMYDGS